MLSHKNEHTTGISNPSEFSLKYYVDNLTLIGNCFHNSCRESNIKLLDNLFYNLNTKKPLETEININDDKRFTKEIPTILKKTNNISSDIEEYTTGNSDNNSDEKSLEEMTPKHLAKFKQLLIQLKEVSTPSEINRIRSNIRYYETIFEKPEEQ